MQTQYALKQAGLTLPVTKESVIRTTVQNPGAFIPLKYGLP